MISVTLDVLLSVSVRVCTATAPTNQESRTRSAADPGENRTPDVLLVDQTERNLRSNIWILFDLSDKLRVVDVSRSFFLISLF